jgi:cytochrome c oxidase subunit 1
VWRPSSFVGFKLTFFPQFVLGIATAVPLLFRRVSGPQPAVVGGAPILIVGYVVPMFYLVWSMRYGPKVV